MALLSNLQPLHEALTNWLPILTPLTLVGLAWKARGFFDNLVNNHFTHMKQEIIQAVTEGVEKEEIGHKEIVDTITASNKEVINTIREGNDRIVDTLITLR